MTLYSLGSLARVLDAPGGEEARLRRLVGLMLPRVVAQVPGAARTVGWHVAQIVRAFAEGRAECYFDAFGRPAGSLMWKRLDAAGEEALGEGSEVVALDDAADGDAWVAHLVAHAGLRALLRHAVAAGPLATLPDIAYARMCRGWRIAKRLRIPQRTAVAAPPPPAGFLADGGGGQMRGEAIEMLAQAERLGDWLLLVGAHPHHADRPPAELLAALSTPLRLDQWIDVVGPDGATTAFMAYGLLTGDGVSRFRREGATALCPACFSEGDVLTATCAVAVDADAAARLAERAAALHPGLRREPEGDGVPALWPS